MKRASPIWLVVLVAVIASLIVAQCNCRKRGGILVKTVAGAYACVKEVP